MPLPASSAPARIAASSIRATASSTSPAWPAGEPTRPTTAASSASATPAIPSNCRSRSTSTRTACWSRSPSRSTARPVGQASQPFRPGVELSLRPRLRLAGVLAEPSRRRRARSCWTSPASTSSTNAHCSSRCPTCSRSTNCTCSCKSMTGQPQELFVTVHELDQPVHRLSRLSSRRPRRSPPIRKRSIWPCSARRIPNPWRKQRQPIPTALLEIAAGKNLTFSTRTLRAKAGEADPARRSRTPTSCRTTGCWSSPARWPQVGDLANKLIADPEAVLRQYVPQTDDVLVYTDIVAPQESFTIYFPLPRREGPLSVPLHVPRPLDGDERRADRGVSGAT